MKLERKGTSNRKVHLFVQWFATPALPALLLPCCLSLFVLRSVPAEGDVTRSVASLLHQGFVKLSSGARVDGRPAVLAVVLQTGDVGAEERRELPAAASSLALIAQLVIQHVWLHFHLQSEVRVVQMVPVNYRFWVNQFSRCFPEGSLKLIWKHVRKVRILKMINQTFCWYSSWSANLP